MARLKILLAFALFTMACGGTTMTQERVNLNQSRESYCNQTRMVTDPSTGERVDLGPCQRFAILDNGQSYLMFDDVRKCKRGDLILVNGVERRIAACR